MTVYELHGSKEQFLSWLKWSSIPELIQVILPCQYIEGAHGVIIIVVGNELSLNLL